MQKIIHSEHELQLPTVLNEKWLHFEGKKQVLSFPAGRDNCYFIRAS